MRWTKVSFILSLFLTALPAAVLFPSTLLAQKVTNTVEGVAGYVDSSHRNPVISVSTIVETGNVKILADAYVPRKEYLQFPLQFDFFVNRKLYSSQYRSSTLGGPVGVDIGADVVTPPFNYAVVVKVIHPNREYKSVLEGAVFSSNLSATLTCSLTKAGEEGADPTVYTAQDISSVQTGESSFSFEFTGRTEDEEAKADVTATVTLSGSTATASLSVVEDDTTQSYETTGTATTADNSLSALAVKNSSETISLDCSL